MNYDKVNNRISFHRYLIYMIIQCLQIDDVFLCSMKTMRYDRGINEYVRLCIEMLCKEIT